LEVVVVVVGRVEGVEGGKREGVTNHDESPA
jgi:hypothetical protein